MQTREQLIEAAHTGLLINHATTYDFHFLLDGVRLVGDDLTLVFLLFDEDVFTFDNGDVDLKAVDIPVRLVED